VGTTFTPIIVQHLVVNSHAIAQKRCSIAWNLTSRGTAIYGVGRIFVGMLTTKCVSELVGDEVGVVDRGSFGSHGVFTTAAGV
jgi:hypothetical protein